MKKTFMFTDLDYIQHMYPTILKIQKFTTYNQARAIFGFTPSDNIGKSAFPAVQACPAFPSTFHIPLKGSLDMPCLIPCAIDQVILLCHSSVSCDFVILLLSHPASTGRVLPYDP